MTYLFHSYGTYLSTIFSSISNRVKLFLDGIFYRRIDSIKDLESALNFLNDDFLKTYTDVRLIVVDRLVLQIMPLETFLFLNSFVFVLFKQFYCRLKLILTHIGVKSNQAEQRLLQNQQKSFRNTQTTQKCLEMHLPLFPCFHFMVGFK